MEEIYLDYNATTPIDSYVQEHITLSLKTTWANPSSSSSLGVLAKNAIETARQEVALALHANPCDIIFTSGGTEANNMAIFSAVKNALEKGFVGLKPHIITSNVEHVATSNTIAELVKSYNVVVTEVNVDKQGMLSSDDVLSAITHDTCLVTLMLANNETGVIFPIREVSRALKKINNERKEFPKILLHTDAAQAIGKIEVDVSDLGVDYLTVVGHKFYGPRIGALYVNSLGKSNSVHPILQGGGQERGYRPGTENTAMIVGLGKAAKLVNENLSSYKCQMKMTRDYLEIKLREIWDDVVVNCCTAPRLPNTANVSFRGIPCNGNKLLAACNRTIASTTAACHSQDEPSSVLIASGVTRDLAISAIRFSTGRETTQDEIDIVVDDIKNAILKLTVK